MVGEVMTMMTVKGTIDFEPRTRPRILKDWMCLIFCCSKGKIKVFDGFFRETIRVLFGF